MKLPHNRIFSSASASLYKIAVLILVVFMSIPEGIAPAVTGQAERLDEVKEADLKEFQQALIEEEQQRNLDKADEIVSTIKRRRRELETAEGEEKKLIERELEHLEKELLNLPERDRIRFNVDGNATYDPNIGRQSSDTSSDVILTAESSVEFDLSQKKTDLRWEWGVGRIWNINFSRNDFWVANTQIRYRRKMFKKIIHSLHSRVSRTSSRTIEIDDDRIRWDMNNTTALNYQFSPKFSANMGFSQQKRLFTQEEFDQDSGWGVTLSPAFFWQFTPKSRVSLGYSYSARRDRVESGDANSHDIFAGYFGQLTRKSSISFNIGYTRQNPKSIEGSTVNSWRTGLGWIYQWTSKTQAAVNLFRSWQNTTSDRVSFESSDDNVVRNENNFSNDSVTVSLNSRLTKTLSVTMSTGISHIKTELTRSDEVESGNDGTRRWTWPSSINFSYLVNRWLRINAGYSFFLRTGNEDNDSAKAHIFNGGFNLIF